MKKTLVGVAIIAMVLAIFSMAVFNFTRAVSFDCHWAEISNGLHGGTVHSLAIDSNDTVYAGLSGAGGGLRIIFQFFLATLLFGNSPNLIYIV